MTRLAGQTQTWRRWVKARDTAWARRVYGVARWLRTVHVPVAASLHFPLYLVHRAVAGSIHGAKRVLWFTPIFQARLVAPAPGLYLYNGLPLVLGAVTIRIGSNCRMGGQSNITGRTATSRTPSLTIGTNCDVGSGCTLAVGRRIVIGDNVRIAAGVHLAGYPGHPVEAAARARGEPDTDDQIGDIVLEDDVWLATGVCVLRGVTIGRGTIVGAGSVVTRDLPPFVLAGGAPARVIRQLAAATTDAPPPRATVGERLA